MYGNQPSLSDVISSPRLKETIIALRFIIVITHVINNIRIYLENTYSKVLRISKRQEPEKHERATATGD